MSRIAKRAARSSPARRLVGNLAEVARMVETTRLVQRGLSKVRSDPRHALQLGHRRALLSSLGTGEGSGGRQRRIELESLAVEKVLPSWISESGDTNDPRRLLQMARQVVAGTGDPVQAESVAGDFVTLCDDLSARRGWTSAVMVGYAAAQVVFAAVSEDIYGCEAVDPELEDTDVDSEELDASVLASVAYAGGAAWDDAGDAAKRLEFWEWWLGEASSLASR